jgi:putative membrane protein
MSIIAKIAIGIIAIEHIYILWLEMFAWTTRARKVFPLPKDLFEPTKTMAANQGLYNGFLAAGLIWSLLISNLEWSQNIALFFLGCVLVAGLYGGLTVSKRILAVQAVPALIAILFVLFV